MPDLGLQIQAERHFGFLVTEYGFRPVESTPYLVQFRSNSVNVELLFEDGRGFQLDLEVGLIESNKIGQSYSLGEILRLRAPAEAAPFRCVQVTTAEAMARFVAEFARQLGTYGGDFIKGNQTSFAELAELHQRESQAYMLELSLSQARKVAGPAWQNHDFPAFIEALEPLRDALTPSERGKLDYAKKHVVHTWK